MSYDEHLISMAGGDGDALDRLATIQKANEMWMTSPHVNRDDRNTAFLLAHIREQQDQLDRVEAQVAATEELAEIVVGEDLQAGLRMVARGIRAAITATEAGE